MFTSKASVLVEKFYKFGVFAWMSAPGCICTSYSSYLECHRPGITSLHRSKHMYVCA